MIFRDVVRNFSENLVADSTCIPVHYRTVLNTARIHNLAGKTESRRREAQTGKTD
jgi:hypothetical protein